MIPPYLSKWKRCVLTFLNLWCSKPHQDLQLREAAVPGLGLELEKNHYGSRLRHESRTVHGRPKDHMQEQSLFAFVIVSTVFSSVEHSLTYTYITCRHILKIHTISPTFSLKNWNKSNYSCLYETKTKHFVLKTNLKKEEVLHDITSLWNMSAQTAALRRMTGWWSCLLLLGKARLLIQSIYS